MDDLVILGEVKKPLALDLENLRGMRSVTIEGVRLWCKHKKVAEICNYKGVPLKEILEEVGYERNESKAFHVNLWSRDGYVATFSWGELFFSENPVIIAYERDGKSLEIWEGPIRCIAPVDKILVRYVRGLRMIEVRDALSS